MQRDYHIQRGQPLLMKGAAFKTTPAEMTIANDEAAHLLIGQYGEHEPTPEALEARREATRLQVGRVLVFTASNGTATYECIDMDVARSLWRRIGKTNAKGEALE